MSVQTHKVSRTERPLSTTSIVKRPLQNFLSIPGVVLALLTYLVFALLAFWPIGPLSSTHLVTCGCNDIAEQTWFLAWPHYALLHGLNPLFSEWINYPYGVNIAANASMPLLGTIAIPINAIFGAIATFNFLIRLAFFLSAASMFFVLRRFVRFTPAAFLGGLFYGFSPYMVGQGNGHINLAFIPIPPLIFLLLVELVVRQQRSARRTGLMLGVLLTAQLLISSEILASTIVLAVIGFVGLALVRHRDIGSHCHHILVGIAWALLPFIVIGGYPIWYFLEGPQHITGPAQPIVSLTPYRSDLLGPIVPTIFERLAPSRLIAIGDKYSAGNLPEDGSYLGVPLLAGVIATAIYLRRSLLVRFVVAMTVVAFILALGTRLTINNHVTSIPLPFALFTHLPLLDSEVALRYFLFIDLFIAVILAIGIDAIAGDRRQIAFPHELKPIGETHRRNAVRCLIALTLGIAVLLPLLPRLPYDSPSTGVPAYITSMNVTKIPASSVALAYPYPINPNNMAMLWSAESGMRFKLPGDYAIIPDANGNGTTAPPLLQPSVVQVLFEAAMYGPSSPLGAPPPYSSSTFAQIRQFLARYDISTVLLQPLGVHPRLAIRYLTTVIGPPTHISGMYIWYDVPRLIRNSKN